MREGGLKLVVIMEVGSKRIFAWQMLMKAKSRIMYNLVGMP
jgi:hypothetical protein